MAGKGKITNGRSASARSRRGSGQLLRGTIGRVRGRVTIVGLATACAAALWAFYSSDELQSKICTVPAIQPAISDACGSLNIGGRPNRSERVAWEAVRRRPGNCGALSAHIAKYPEGAYRQQARDLLEARHISAQGPWLPGESTINIYQPRSALALASESAARHVALTNARRLAERECRKQSAVLKARFVRATATPEDWNCDKIGGGLVCGFHGHAKCQIQTPAELCGAAR